MKGYASLVLLCAVGCGAGDSEALGTKVCSLYAAACEPLVDQCFEEFAKFSGHEDHDECAGQYLVGRACQAGVDIDTLEQAEPRCEIPGVCGDMDPYDQMMVCVQAR